jgi:hypothetical protein
MKDAILKPCLGLLLAFVLSTVAAQQGVVSAGGDFSGTGGSMSLSTGLTDFYFYESSAGNLQFGLQHASPFSEGEPDEHVYLFQMVIGDEENSCFAALQSITLAGDGRTFVVESGGRADLISAGKIIMMYGTKVEPGGYLHARITTDGTFCPEPDKHFLAATQADQPVTTGDFPNMEQPETFFKVYPNPTSGRFTLEMNLFQTTNKVIVEVYGMRGERILSEEITPGQYVHAFSLMGHLPGVYIIRVLNGDRFGVGKVIKR